MPTSHRLCSVVFASLFVLAGAASASAQQTIVFFRHAEKPSSGNGQLTCQGLNRALALPGVLFSRYGKPDWAYAPNPAVTISDPGGVFFYVRPLTTIEPSVIQAGISVNLRYGYTDIAHLQNRLITSSKKDSTIYVAWEHTYLVKEVQNIMNEYGGGVKVPDWTFGDYDSLYVVHVDYSSNGITATFQLDHEGLNGQSTACPS